MGTPAAVLGDRIVGICGHHLTPLGFPAGPLPFSAPLTLGVVPTVLVAGKPAVVVGARGLNTPPHPFVADPPPTQTGTVLVGSPTVLAGGRPLARTGSTGTCCVAPGVVTGTAATVLVA